MSIASGRNLAVTLGLNLVPLAGDAGVLKWSGHFEPNDKEAAIPYLEALTWNPRRIFLFPPEVAEVCWRCGQAGITAVGRMAYLGNEQTKARKGKGNKTILFTWQDPSAFYGKDKPYTTIKSLDEELATTGNDLNRLLEQEVAPRSAVVVGNPGHQEWHLVIPCTTGKDKKTFDHRQIDLAGFLPVSIRSMLPATVPASGPQGIDGWVDPQRASRGGGTARFVHAASRLLTHTDWVVLSNAAYQEMHDAPAAFDLLSGLLWSLRGKVRGLPSKNVAWLVLKLMAGAPARARVPHTKAAFCPLQSAESRRFLPKRQIDERRKDRPVLSPYPVSFPRGRRLEEALRGAIDSNMRQRTPKPIDWTGLCHGLDQLLD